MKTTSARHMATSRGAINIKLVEDFPNLTIAWGVPLPALALVLAAFFNDYY